jgi:HEPN domain-containing protein
MSLSALPKLLFAIFAATAECVCTRKTRRHIDCIDYVCKGMIISMSDKVAYWLDLCDDDLITAKALLKSKRLLHMGFFCHMIIEKSLKAVIAHRLGEIPPKIHDLQKLAVRGSVFDNLSDEHFALIDTLKPLQIEARYPEYKERIAETLSVDTCQKILAETEGFLCWIKQLLGG